MENVLADDIHLEQGSVEDEETLEILRHLNIDYAQGYYIHKPEEIS